MTSNVKSFLTLFGLMVSIISTFGLISSIASEKWTIAAVSAFFVLLMLWIYQLRFLGVKVTVDMNEL